MIGVTGRCDEVTGDRVDVRDARAWLRGCHTGLLRRGDEPVDVPGRQPAGSPIATVLVMSAW